MAEGFKLNLLFLRKSLSSPLHEVSNILDGMVEAWDKLWALDFLNSISRVAEECLCEDKSAFASEYNEGRCLKSKIADSRKSTAGESLDWNVA